MFIGRCAICRLPGHRRADHVGQDVAEALAVRRERGLAGKVVVCGFVRTHVIMVVETKTRIESGNRHSAAKNRHLDSGMTRLRSIPITEQNVNKVFDLLETRTPLSQIATDTNLSIRNVERLSTAKRYLDKGTRLELWPGELLSAWPRLGADLVRWHGSWVSRKDDPRSDARRRHADNPDKTRVQGL